MDTERFTKILLGIMTIMLFVNFLYGVFEIRRAGAVKENEVIGRLSSSAVQSEAYNRHNGK